MVSLRAEYQEMRHVLTLYADVRIIVVTDGSRILGLVRLTFCI